MTVQAAERVMYQGKEYRMDNRPLEVYFEIGGKRVPFLVSTTMCWRGYFGSWSIDDGKLKLISLEGHIAEKPLLAIADSAFRHQIDYDDRRLCRIATIRDVFPDHDGPVFAHWYSGTIDAIDQETRTIPLRAIVRRGLVSDIQTSQAIEAS